MNTTTTKERWYSGITYYQWLVLGIALVGWMFDIFEGQIFVASMNEAIPSFLTEFSATERAAKATFYNNVALISFLLGGTLGGVVFGMLSDRVGRKKTMAYSILFYSFFTWITAFSQEWWHLALLRFFVAIGVGGQWAVASAFIAEVFPSKARAHAASIFHAFGSLGTFLAAGVGAFVLGSAAVETWCRTSSLLTWTHSLFEPVTLPWRLCFTIGLLPSILVFFILFLLKEPESWTVAKKRATQNLQQQTGVIIDLFKGTNFRSTLVGVSLAGIGMATFWGVHVNGKNTLRLAAERQTISTISIVDTEPQFSNSQTGLLKRWEMFGMILVTIGLLFGQLYFGPLSQKIGRKNTFVFFHLGAFMISMIVLQISWEITVLCFLLPVFGFFTAGMHAGYAVYFPELYPTRLRGTGTGFCFNMGRFMASPFLLITGWMVSYGGFTFLGATTILSFLYLLGPVAVLFGKETRGTELTE
ncbi:MAG: MFS transporter [Planctomycetaceae bacterium]|jgi:MFS family permease|nr:MFS transporter [Planctomycetaceae bacterium]